MQRLGMNIFQRITPVKTTSTPSKQSAQTSAQPKSPALPSSAPLSSPSQPSAQPSAQPQSPALPSSAASLTTSQPSAQQQIDNSMREQVLDFQATGGGDHGAEAEAEAQRNQQEFAPPEKGKYVFERDKKLPAGVLIGFAADIYGNPSVKKTVRQIKKGKVKRFKNFKTSFGGDTPYSKKEEGKFIKIANALKFNNTVETFQYSNYGIGDNGAKAIAEALKTNTSLKELDLSDNPIGHEGVMDIAEALKTNTSLTSLNLSNCDIGEEECQAIAEALQLNNSLKYLNFRDCGLNREKMLEVFKEKLVGGARTIELSIQWTDY